MPQQSALDRCRKCGTPLNRDVHARMTIGQPLEVREYDDQGHERIRHVPNVSVEHKPCPNCGEARPLESAGARRNKLIAIAMFVGIIGLCLGLLLFA